MPDPPRSTGMLNVTSRAWDGPARRPPMANVEDRRAGIELTSRGLRRRNQPWIPVSGEIHYSRVPRQRWAQRLRQMRAGGISVVACYVPWLHHMPEPGTACFGGNLDVAAFVDLVTAQGMDIVLRIGPWTHGEMRNGGFPDWVQAAPVRHRTNDPAYLDLVRQWWERLAETLHGRCRPEVVLGIQLENELYDQPEHLVELKRLARACGFSAPLWTATGWGGARLPDPEVFPLFGGYGDGFWVDADAAWDPAFRRHFFFSHVWDDPGIGADVRGLLETDAAAGSPWFPPATCEVGGGMATAYHRRPRPSAADIAAVAHCKIGNGSAWQGFYMYTGGANPPGGFQESHATGYPNDMPPLSYDFHAPVGESGLLAPSHAMLRRHNAFVHAFGAQLGDMPSHLPRRLPTGVGDRHTLRWAVRGHDTAGFLFIAWHQPHIPLPAYRGAQFRVEFADAEVVLPSRPVDIPAGTLAQWPVRTTIGGIALSWVTASALTVLAGEIPTLVLIENPGVPVELAVAAEVIVTGPEALPSNVFGGSTVHELKPGHRPLRLTTRLGSTLDLLILPADVADSVWIQTDAHGCPQRLLISPDELTWDARGLLEVRTPRVTPDVVYYQPDQGEFAVPMLTHRSGRSAATPLTPVLLTPATDAPAEYGRFQGRPSAPPQKVMDNAAAVYRLTLPETADDPDDPGDPDSWLVLAWAGDVAQLLVDGTVVADRFWDGSEWPVNTRDCAITSEREVLLRIVAMAKGSPVHLPKEAAERLSTSDGQLCVLDSARYQRHSVWAETAHDHTLF